MSELRALVTCRHVWSEEDEVSRMLAGYGVAADFPRYNGQQLEESDLLPILRNYDGILAGDDALTRRVLESAPRLRVISKWGVGIDGIDSEAALSLGIQVFNTPGVFGGELADYAMGFIHMLARRQHEVNTKVKTGSWHKVRGVSLSGMTLGIVGLGSSGRALAQRAAAADMLVLGYDVVTVEDIPHCRVCALDELLALSDIVSLHLPVTKQSRRLINSNTLGMLKEGAWLVNISRGGLVDESALLSALDSGAVAAAALDVFEDEPAKADHPLVRHDSVVVGSHNGSNTLQAVERTTWMSVHNLLVGLGCKK